MQVPTRARRRRVTVVRSVATAIPLAAALVAGSAVPSLAASTVAHPASPGSAATPAPTTKVAVGQGIGPAMFQHAAVFGTTPADTPETVSFVLKERHLRQLEAQVELDSSAHLSVAGFAGEYGQPLSVTDGLRAYLGQFGISSHTYADRIDVTATGTAGEFDRALSVQQHQYEVPARPGVGGHAGVPAQRVHGTTQSPRLPYRIARNIVSVLGLTNYAPFASDPVHKITAAAGVTLHTTYTGNLTPEDFAKNYHLDPLYSRGDTGAGQTIGIVTLASVNPSVPYHFWRDILHITVPSNKITLDNVDGGAGPVSLKNGSDETTLDVEQSGAIARNASVVVYQAPNTDYGFADAFFAAASQNTADVVSTSWGESETAIAATVAAGQESPTYVQAYDEAFLELAAQGQTTFASAGDAGAYDASSDLGSTNLSIDNPSDSPFLTAAGGTTLAGSIRATLPSGKTITASVPAQRAWGWDYLWPLYKAFGAKSERTFAEANVVGGGGGFSAVEGKPIYQRGVAGTSSSTAVRYLTPDNYRFADGLLLPTKWRFDPTPSVSVGYGSGRATPDLATDADPFTGYELYDPQFSGPKLALGYGGTSFVAPQLAGATAVIDQYVGGRTGFWNPAIYSFATSGDSPFTPLDTVGTSNDNLYYSGTPGHVFNPGSGLGVPDLARLASDFAHPPRDHPAP